MRNPRGQMSNEMMGRTWRWVIVLAAAILSAVVSWYFLGNELHFFHDDAFISFVYAEHLADGDGFVFNLGERVWGYTSPLQTSILALCSWLGASITKIAPVLSIGWIGLAAILIRHLLRDVLPGVLSLLPALFVLTWGTGYEFLGLESNLLVFLQCSFLCAVIAGRGSVAGLLAALCCLARPDSLLFVVPLLLTRKVRRPATLVWFAVPGVLWLAFAYSYYGEAVPNSLNAKHQVSGSVEYFRHAVGWFTSFFPSRTPSTVGGWSQNVPEGARILVTGLLVACSLSALFNQRLRKAPALVYSLLVYPWLQIGAYAAIGAPMGHVWELYSGHFFFAVSYCVGVASMLEMLWRRCCDAAGLARVGLRTICWVAIGAAVTMLARNTEQSLAFLKQNKTTFWGGGRHSTYLEISDWLNNNLAAQSSVAMTEVGTLAYYTDLQVIDLGGIVTKGYLREERNKPKQFLIRFRPRYALLQGDFAEYICNEELRYGRLQYFPKSGFKDFTLLEQR